MVGQSRARAEAPDWNRYKDRTTWLPIGMPVVRKLEPKLWEVRSDLDGIIARIIFTVVGSQMILLHGFIKKSQKTPAVDLQTARQRNAKL